MGNAPATWRQESVFDLLEKINSRPKPFEFYTAADLWADEHTSQRMLAYHLDPDLDVSSRRREFMERSVQWIASRFHVGAGTRIADFGCGPGLYANRLGSLGARVTGIDFSRRSVEYARGVADRKGLAVEYVNRNYLDFETDDRFQLVLLIMCDFCALSPAQRKVMLGKFHSLLLPGGSVLLDVYSLNAFEQRQEETSYGLNILDGFWSPRNYYGFLNTFKYGREKVVLDQYTIVEAERIRTVYNWFQYFSLESLQKELEQAGFKLQERAADVAGAPFDRSSDEFAVVAWKH
jgi:SAM-dependent methyltransferase